MCLSAKHLVVYLTDKLNMSERNSSSRQRVVGLVVMHRFPDVPCIVTAVYIVTACGLE